MRVNSRSGRSRGAGRAGHPGSDDLREEVRGRFFPREAGAPVRVGVEAEWIPLLSGSGHPAPLHDPAGPSLLSMLHGCSERAGWTERVSDAAVVSFHAPTGGKVSFEPGGQVEYSSPPFAGTAPLLADLHHVAGLLARAAEREGIHLLAVGIDPVNPVERAELLIANDRYRRMARHFDGYGPAGRRMMRQTAAFHVNVDFGPDPRLQWRVANALVPLLIAIFANSARYAGRATGFRSFRAQQWRELMPGVPPDAPTREGSADPVKTFYRAALGAPALLLGPEDAAPLPFERWVGSADLDAWRRHLTTLFPEVRPRGYMEIRSCDALPPRWHAAPVVFLLGLLCDPGTLAEAALRLPPAGFEELEAAGRYGLHDPARLALARDLFDLALEGARRLGEDVVDGAAIRSAEEFRDRFTAKGRDPAGVED
jgi:glutamate--cysteine ligase